MRDGQRRTNVGAFKQLGMVAHLAELHDKVHEALQAAFVVGIGLVDELGYTDVRAQALIQKFLAR